jgi:hypothetical protein
MELTLFIGSFFISKPFRLVINKIQSLKIRYIGLVEIYVVSW